jgi:hypothetical protein
VNQGHLFDSKIVSLAAFRAHRETPHGEQRPAPQWPATPRPLAMRSAAHLARMLAHLESQAGSALAERG